MEIFKRGLSGLEQQESMFAELLNSKEQIQTQNNGGNSGPTTGSGSGSGSGGSGGGTEPPPQNP